MAHHSKFGTERDGEFLNFVKVRRYGLTFPILLDTRREVAGAYQTHHFPESFLIDAEGRVVERYIGPRDWDAPEYVARIRALLPVLR